MENPTLILETSSNSLMLFPAMRKDLYRDLPLISEIFSLINSGSSSSPNLREDLIVAYTRANHRGSIARERRFQMSKESLILHSELALNHALDPGI